MGVVYCTFYLGREGEREGKRDGERERERGRERGRMTRMERRVKGERREG